MEVWKSVIGYEGLYSVSSHGNVRSESRVVNASNGTRCVIGKMLKKTIGGTGYPMVNLSNKKTMVASVHRLVSEAFIPNPLSKRTVNHKDGDRTNNNVSNLEWATYQENMKHSYSVLNRNRAIGEKINNSKLTEILVIEIRERYKNEKISHRALAKSYGLAHGTIGPLLRRQTWKHIK